MNQRHRHCGVFSLLIIGTIFVSVGLWIFFDFNALFDNLIRTAMTFDPHSEPYRVWRINDPPLDIDFYLFNWTNPEQLREPGVKMHFAEVGPYRFLEVREKINLTWYDNNDTISFQHKKWYFYDEENSVRKLDDVITTINVVPLTIAYKVRHSGYFPKKIVSISLKTLSKIHVRKTARELLFDGYEEKILSILSGIPLSNVPNKFGLFYQKNGSWGGDGIYNMYTKNERFGRVAWWNYKTNTNYYKGHCGDVRGSMGEFHPINRERNYIEIFSSELCKYAHLEYEKDVLIKGVRGFKYTGRNIFDNGSTRAENACFCPGDCHPSGILNVSVCRDNSPTFLSMPHFYGADPYYYTNIEGVSPADKHEFYITLEPKSGIAIDVGARMQVNMLLQPIKDITLYENVPRIYIPMFYFDQTILLKDDLASILEIVQKFPEIGTITVMVLIVLGVIMYALFAFTIYRKSKSSDENEEKNLQKNKAKQFDETKRKSDKKSDKFYENIPLQPQNL